MEFKENKKDDLIADDEYRGAMTKKKAKGTVLFLLILTLIFVWYTFDMYNDFQDLENNVRDIELQSIPYLLYEIGGKWFALLFPVGFVLFLSGMSIKIIGKISKGDYEES